MSRMYREKDSNSIPGFFLRGKGERVRQKPEKRAELRLVVDVDSVLEEEDQQGLTHFAEHMAFNGTQHFAKQQLIDYREW